MASLRFATAPSPDAQSLDRAHSHSQQPGLNASHVNLNASYVNLNASRSDFERVLARLAAESPLLPLDPTLSAVAASGSHATHPVSAGSWGGLLNGLLGSLHSSSSQSHGQPPLSNDDDLPLSRAVVMFTASWCGPCKMVHKELKLAVRKLDGRPPCAVIVIDVEVHKELASVLGVKALPTLLYLGRDGARAPVYTQGPVSSSAILDTMDRAAGFGGRDITAKWLKL